MKTTPPSPATSGPWFFDPVELIVYDGDEKTSKAVATVKQRQEPREDSDETSANGWLIAAAPNLLALAKSFRCTCEERLGCLEDEKSWRPEDEYEDMVGHYIHLRNRCTEVIAKVHGRA